MRATHYADGRATLCGFVGSGFVTQDVKKVDCLSCRKTAKFRNLRYGPARIAWELDQTAMGAAFYGNALRVAKDFDCVTPEDRGVLDSYATGRAGSDPRSLSERIKLQEIANKIRATTPEGGGR